MAGKQLIGYYACGKKCEKPLKGCRHACQLSCHEGTCEEHCKEEVKAVCPCGRRVEKRMCWDVQHIPGYDITKPVQIVLQCDDNCKKLEQPEQFKQPEQPEMIEKNQPTPMWLYLALLVLVIAILLGLGLKFAQ